MSRMSASTFFVLFLPVSSAILRLDMVTAWPAVAAAEKMERLFRGGP